LTRRQITEPAKENAEDNDCANGTKHNQIERHAVSAFVERTRSKAILALSAHRIRETIYQPMSAH